MIIQAEVKQQQQQSNLIPLPTAIRSIDGEDISIQADLITGKATVHSDGEVEEYDWSDIEMNEIYRREHEAVLTGDSRMACTYEGGLETMRLIDNIRAFNN